MTLRAEVDPNNPALIIFNEPATLAEAVAYLWGQPPPGYPNPLRAETGDTGATSRHRRFVVDTSAPGLLLAIVPEHINQTYVRRIQGGVIRTTAPLELPRWVPQHVQTRIFDGRMPNGVSHFQGTAPWGDIVVWLARGTFTDVQVYQEFPSALEFYVQLTGGDRATARLLHDVYVQFNRDMRYFLARGRSPEQARAEIRRINDECFRLVLEAAVAMLTAGATIMSVRAAMQANSRRLSAAARTGTQPLRRSRVLAEEFADELRREGQPVLVNIGGEGEVAHAINLNPQRRLRTDIPRLVQGGAEDIREIFPANSVNGFTSNRLPPDTIDWNLALPGIHRALRRGGRIEIRFQGSGVDGRSIMAQFRRLGFRNIQRFAATWEQAVPDIGSGFIATK